VWWKTITIVLNRVGSQKTREIAKMANIRIASLRNSERKYGDERTWG